MGILQTLSNHLSTHHRFWGIFLLAIGFIDSFTELSFGTPYNVLWFSNVAFYFLAFGFYFKNPFVLTASFLGYFIGEMGWILDFISHLFFGAGWFGTTDYMFAAGMPAARFFLELNHFLISFSALMGVLKFGIHPRGWLLTGFAAIALNIGAFAITPITENVNCVHEFCLNASINGGNSPIAYLAGWTLFLVAMGYLENRLLVWLSKYSFKKRARTLRLRAKKGFTSHL